MQHDPELWAPEATTRLAALRRLAASHLRPPPAGTNTHVHTPASFSAFRSVAEAVWLAWSQGVEVFGINDHYTLDGHDEFRQCCAAVGLAAVFGLEAVALDREAAAGGVLLNDPGNPGRVYYCGKGITCPGDPEALVRLEVLRRHLEARHRAMVELVDRHLAHLGLPPLGWSAVSALTPRGNVTERHIAQALDNLLIAQGTGAYEKVAGAPPPVGGSAARQNDLRSRLLKAGKPCYAPEDPAAYPDLAALRAVYLRLGAIPTYPVLGNPVTGGEADIPALFDRLEATGTYAVELIPSRNTEERVAAVLSEASRRGWPVFDGTEHNTPAMEPLLTRWSQDPRFRPAFRQGALVLLGHQSLRSSGLPGYVDAQGRLEPGGLERCRQAGAEVLRTTVSA